ncbi:Bifunctional UDP-N-acetylglucosamine pyrophosphorylase / Glucosamine-1-phosphate N-acetyltransferase [Planctomycetales bacterium 10988]|nr:Bifunctional UDP-N-acetylglucosamine pyrophosphorylase / Glucosamine-1-phosphate N-acetyltransferase [Planctomycetales bacterium 10988]
MPENMEWEAPVAIIMAAGRGSRMQSELPKVLVSAQGRPLIDYVLDSAIEGGIRSVIVVVGYEANRVREHVQARPQVSFVEQTEQLGTGHAIAVCEEALSDYEGPVMILAGDSPMIRSESLKELLTHFQREKPACLLGTAYKQNPTGLGRIVRDREGNFIGIVEEKDATDEQRAIQEVNLSTYVFSKQKLFEALQQIRPNNAQGEYYLTDCPRLLLNRDEKVLALPILHPSEALSVNNLDELAAVEQALQHE